ncbi:MAG TPA: VOC family protein [Nitrososphaeraceae archaeon]|jgi:PhnB protein
MSTKTSNNNHDTNIVSPVPKGYDSITPHIFVKSSVDAIEFYKKVFGAIEVSRYTIPGNKDRGRGEKVIHAVLNIRGSKLLLADEFSEMCDEHVSNVGKIGAPSTVGGNSVFFNLYFENVDEIFDKAQREGATVIMPLMDAFWGDRYGQIRDPFGHIWEVATHKKDVSKEELEKAANEAFQKMGK